VLAIGRLPGFRVDRTGACIIGASLMIACGVLDIEQAFARSITTPSSFCRMMIVVANLSSRDSSAPWPNGVEHAHRPVVLLAAIVFVAGFFPLSSSTTPCAWCSTPGARNRPPTAPQTRCLTCWGGDGGQHGSVATITGNPQNMMIGSFSGIHYRAFAAALSPVAAVGLVLTVIAIAAIYHRGVPAQEKVALVRRRLRVNRVLMGKSWPCRPA